MYCQKCGKELINEEAFCPVCGTKQNTEKYITIDKGEDKKRLYAFYIAVATSPVLFIFRMLGQTNKRIEAGGGSWRAHDVYLLPGNIQAVMILVLLCSTILNIALRKNSDSTDKSKSGITTVLVFVNILFGMFITFTEF